jgi:hypothetical protein
MSNLTARASNAAMMSAQASSEIEVPLLEGVVLVLFVDIRNAPYDPDDTDAVWGF